MNVTILKKNIEGEETWRYEGQMLSRDDETITVEARFNRPDLPFLEITFKQGDRFVETFYTARWYNVFAIYDRDDDAFKGCYCNISFPAEIEQAEDGWTVSYRDLALDLFVYPDGRQVVLDRDEFAALTISPSVRQKAQQALAELIEKMQGL